MATRQTFHTPSFGDEEFEILTAPTFEHHQQSAAELSLNIQPASVSLSSPSSSFHSTTTALPIATNQSSIANQWHFTDFQTQSIGSDTIPIIGYGGNTVVMGDNNVIIGDEDEQRYSTITAEDGTLMTTATSSSTATTITKLNSKQPIKKRDPNEPPKPVSAYALFFRDTQAPIKGQNPDASFGEISKIVASMWDALDPEHKNVYKKKSELAKKEYLKSLAAYKESVNNKSPKEISSSITIQNNDIQQNHNNSTLNPIINTEYISSTPATIIQAKPLETNIQTAPPIVNVLTISRSPIQNSSLTQCIPSIVTGYTSPNQPTTVHVAQIKNPQIQQKLETPVQQLQQQQSHLAQQQNFIASTTTTTNNPANIVSESSTQQVQKCIREGCNNNAIVNPDWEDEYCSNECVIIHCRDVFSQWILSNNSNNVIVTTDSFQTAA